MAHDDKIRVHGFLTLEPSYSATGSVVGARIARVAQKQPRRGRSVELCLTLPKAMFQPLKLTAEVTVVETGADAAASVIIPVDGSMPGDGR